MRNVNLFKQGRALLGPIASTRYHVPGTYQAPPCHQVQYLPGTSTLVPVPVIARNSDCKSFFKPNSHRPNYQVPVEANQQFLDPQNSWCNFSMLHPFLNAQLDKFDNIHCRLTSVCDNMISNYRRKGENTTVFFNNNMDCLYCILFLFSSCTKNSFLWMIPFFPHDASLSSSSS